MRRWIEGGRVFSRKKIELDGGRGQISPVMTEEYQALVQNGNFLIQGCLGASEYTGYECWLFDGVNGYRLGSGNSSILMADELDKFLKNVPLLSYLNSYGDYINQDVDEANKLRDQIGANGFVEDGVCCVIPSSCGKKILTIEVVESGADHVFLFEMEWLSDHYKERLRFEIKAVEGEIPCEVFTPNGFGDRFLKVGEYPRLFVRDFLPAPEALNVLLSSEGARNEYETEARNRPRVGPINKYGKALELGQYR